MSAVNFAPKRGRIDGVLPSRMRVKRPTRVDRRGALPSLADEHVRSFRSRGSRLSEPPPEPLGKDPITFKMTSESMENASETMCYRAGILESGGSGGYFDLRASRVSLL